MSDTRTVRVTFEKGDRVKFISHLDLNRAFQRAIKRSKIPAVFTQGFNPHVDLVFSPPISVGYLSEGEIAEFKVEDKVSCDEIYERLSKALPDGLKIRKVSEAVKKISEIYYAKYEVTIDSEADFSVFSAMDEVPVIKKSKKGLKEIDIKKYLTAISPRYENGLTVFETVLPCHTDAVNPVLLLKVLCEYYKKDYFYKIKRISFFDKEEKPFC